MTQKCELCKEETAIDAEFVIYLLRDKKRVLPTYLCKHHAFDTAAGNFTDSAKYCFPEKLKEAV